MRVFDFSLLSLLAYPAIAHAVPPNPTIAACNEIKQKLGYRAVAVCSSYLGPVPAKTVTVTATAVHTNLQTITLPAPTQSTALKLTTTVVITSEITRYSDNPTQTETQTVTGATQTVYKYSGAQKRGVLDPALCGIEKKYSKSAVTAACKSICKPSTKTITRTSTATREATQTVTKGPVSTVFVTNTQYVVATQEVDITKTLGPTSTETVQVTTTVTPVLVKPAICNARGLPGANAFNYDANFNTNQANCIASCKTDNRCLATGFYIVTDPGSGATSGTCRKYDKSVTDSSDLGPGYYNFNDKDCPTGSVGGN